MRMKSDIAIGNSGNKRSGSERIRSRKTIFAAAVAAIMILGCFGCMLSYSDDSEAVDYGTAVTPLNGISIYAGEITEGNVFYCYIGSTVSISPNLNSYYYTINSVTPNSSGLSITNGGLYGTLGGNCDIVIYYSKTTTEIIESPMVEVAGLSGYINFSIVAVQSARTVTFDTNGGSSVDSQSVTSGGTATAPLNPTKSRYKFLNWCTDQACTSTFSFSTPITADITLYAKWIDILMFTSYPSASVNVISGTGSSFAFTANIANSAYVTWDMGDGTVYGNVGEVHHEYRPGTYTVALTSYNDNGSVTEYYNLIVHNADPQPTPMWYWFVAIFAAIPIAYVVLRLL